METKQIEKELIGKRIHVINNYTGMAYLINEITKIQTTTNEVLILSGKPEYIYVDSTKFKNRIKIQTKIAKELIEKKKATDEDWSTEYTMLN